jgi:hypothetical protein
MSAPRSASATFAFSTYFLTPLAIPLILNVFAWQGVWLAAAAAACVASVLFPRPLLAVQRA